MNYIEIEEMEFYAYHGHYDVEQRVGNKFLVDLKLETDLSKAGETDKLEDTINYLEVYQLVKKEMEINSSLLENIATRIIKRLHVEFPSLVKVRIKISKMNPPLGGEIKRVSVILEE